jgi:hypothetical protein
MFTEQYVAPAARDEVARIAAKEHLVERVARTPEKKEQDLLVMLPVRRTPTQKPASA